MTTNDRKYYLGYLNKLEEYNNKNNCSIGKKPMDTIILLCLKKLTQILKLLILKLVVGSELLSTKIFLAKARPKTGKRNICY